MSEQIYRPLIEGMTWSYSRIDAFDTCRYKWYLRYIDDPLGVNSRPMFYSSYGTYMHEIIERYYLGRLPKEDMVSEFLKGFSENVEGDRPLNGIVEKYINAAVEYLRNFEPFPYKMLGVEKEIRFELNGEKFLGYIDFLGEDKDGNIVIIDNKSRELKPRSKRTKPTVKDQELDDMLKQLYLYSAWVIQEYGKPPSKLCFNCFKNRQFIEEPFVETKYNETIAWVFTSIEKIKNVTEFYPNIDYFFCKYLCDYGHECAFIS